MRVPGIPFVQGRNDYDDRDDRKYGIAIHNTSNDASDEGEASYATRRTDGISSHFYADADSVTQSIDTDDRVGHAGSYEGNEHAIAFELTGSNGMSRDWWLRNIAWDKVAYVIAYMLKHDPDLAGFQIRRATVAEMQANPKIKAFYGHDDMRRAWGDTTHTDPGPNFPWDHLIASVKQAMTGEDDDMTPEQDAKLNEVHELLTRWRSGMPTMADGKRSIEPVAWRLRDEAWQAKVTANLSTLLGKDWTDEPAIVAGVLAGLSPEAIAAALPADLARRVADELATRLSS